MTSPPEHLTLEDRQVRLQTIESIQRRLTMVAYRLISDPCDPLPGPASDSPDWAFCQIAPATQRWVN